MTADGADSSDEEGSSKNKRLKTGQPEVPETTSSAGIPAMGAMPHMAPMLTAPFMNMGHVAPYLGHLQMPLMGTGMPQMPVPGGSAVSAAQTPPKPLFPASTSTPSSSSAAAKPAFAAYRCEYNLSFI